MTSSADLVVGTIFVHLRPVSLLSGAPWTRTPRSRLPCHLRRRSLCSALPTGVRALRSRPTSHPSVERWIWRNAADPHVLLGRRARPSFASSFATRPSCPASGAFMPRSRSIKRRASFTPARLAFYLALALAIYFSTCQLTPRCALLSCYILRMVWRGHPFFWERPLAALCSFASVIFRRQRASFKLWNRR